MSGVTTLIAAIIQAFPVLEKIFLAIFGAYMEKKHKIDMAKFVEAEREAREGDTTKLQKMIGRKLR